MSAVIRASGKATRNLNGVEDFLPPKIDERASLTERLGNRRDTFYVV